METLNGLKRTHYCGDLREQNIDEEVVLMGWVQKKRNLGGLVFVDLRDRSGICQIIFDTDVNKEAFAKAEKLGTGSLTFRTGSSDKTGIYSKIIVSVELMIEVYAPLKLHPNEIRTIPGGSIELTATGGPQPNTSILYSIDLTRRFALNSPLTR